MPTTSLCLIRHGETDWNAEKRMQGQQDVPLNARATPSADRGGRPRGGRFDCVYSSDLLRALQTAEPSALCLISLYMPRQR